MIARLLRWLRCELLGVHRIQFEATRARCLDCPYVEDFLPPRPRLVRS